MDTVDVTSGVSKKNKKSSDNQSTQDSAVVQTDVVGFSQGELGKIQEILFGRQIRANMEALSSSHSRLEHQMENIAATFNKRLDEVSANLNAELRSLGEKLGEQDKAQIAHADALKSTHIDLTQQLKTAAAQSKVQQQALEGEIDSCREQFNRSTETLRNDLLEELNAAIVKLESTSVDRRTLSTLLTSVAEQLGGVAPAAQRTSS